MTTVEKSDPFSAESLRLTDALSSALAAITGDGGRTHFRMDDVTGPRAVWAIARNGAGEAVGCGAIRPFEGNDGDIAELKRMYSTGQSPGTGTAVLTFLEASAAALGYRQIWLETRRVNLRAVAFYLNRGYVVIDNYGPYVGRDDAVCFARVLE
ncbi:GNAT family N-acetyltransferase [Klebsiella pneumoniae]|nr:GNAT family N-acetyltransferase [Klebsiella pneumoniae]